MSWNKWMAWWFNDEDEISALLQTGLFYPEVNGTVELRQGISELYLGADASNILVTVGASQANNLVCQTLLKSGDEVVVVSPGYRQVLGIARNLGCVVRELQLCSDKGWSVDLEQLDSVISGNIKFHRQASSGIRLARELRADDMRGLTSQVTGMTRSG